MITELKKELIEKISATEDESLLMVLKEDFDELAADAKGEITDHLSHEEKEELKEMLNEPFGDDTISLKEFQKVMNKWSSK